MATELIEDEIVENESRLTTIDNPFDPFEQFTLWLLFDKEQGYNTCERLAREANYYDDMSEHEVNVEHERAIDAVIEYDFLGIYKKVQKKNVKDNIDTPMA